MTPFNGTPMPPHPHNPAPMHAMALETPPYAPPPGGGAPAGRLSTAEAIVIAVIFGFIFTATVVLALHGMPLSDVMKLIGATGAIAAAAAATAMGRISPRRWAKKLSKLAQDD